jgi:hypothetical protein
LPPQRLSKSGYLSFEAYVVGEIFVDDGGKEKKNKHDYITSLYFLIKGRNGLGLWLCDLQGNNVYSQFHKRSVNLLKVITGTELI